jgi:hypothetical protein
MVAKHPETPSSAVLASPGLLAVQWEGHKLRWPQVAGAFAPPATLAAVLPLHLGRLARRRIGALCWTN